MKTPLKTVLQINQEDDLHLNSFHCLYMVRNSPGAFIYYLQEIMLEIMLIIISRKISALLLL